MWGMIPKIRFFNSLSKPFITDTTVINEATPNKMPTVEKKVMKETKPVLFLLRLYRSPMKTLIG
jgi:hypothetical protein